MSTFNAMKKNSAASVEKLSQELEKTNSKKSFAPDESIWGLKPDKAGNASAVIRFLPVSKRDSENENALPWVKIMDHGFKGPTGRWYIELSRTTLGRNEKDPVSEFNSKLWAISDDDKSPTRQQARDQKRRTKYFSNILVIDDPANPQNNGKVFKFRYGQKIFDKITEAMNPEFGDEEKINPFDFWKGANFKIKQSEVAGYPNFDKSKFDSVSALFNGDDKKLEALWESEYSLLELVAPDKFKSYDELREKLTMVMGYDPLLGVNTPPRDIPVATKRTEAVVKQKTVAETLDEVVEEDDDEDILKFSRLAESMED